VDAGLNVRNKRFFDTLVVENADIKNKDSDVNLRHFDNGDVGISLDETHDLEDVNRILKCFGVSSSVSEISTKSMESAERKSAFMTHPVFHSHRSETHMLRYLKSLEVKDIALNHSMIPLGSCTMKLNATSEMIPVTNPQFANVHPFAPEDQTEGYVEMIGQLSDWLCEITGFHAVSNQPNSGASGEYAGLLAIASYLKNKGETERNICLIPASAHGTNPASAVMAGMKVVVVKNKSNGEINMDDLRKKADKHADRLAALMVTYPSTYVDVEARSARTTLSLSRRWSAKRENITLPSPPFHFHSSTHSPPHTHTDTEYSKKVSWKQSISYTHEVDRYTWTVQT